MYGLHAAILQITKTIKKNHAAESKAIWTQPFFDFIFPPEKVNEEL